MKKVLVPMAQLTLASEKSTLHFARATYIKKLVKYDLMPIFVSSLMSETMQRVLYDECDGVLMTGGSDFEPALYKADKHDKTQVNEKERDLLEIRILTWVLKDKKPFLGICRGCQALSIASGGSLHQHISELTDQEHNVETYEDLFAGNKHTITIDKKSHLYEIMKKEQLAVNSAHHQSVSKLGEDFVATAHSSDGIIEAIEYKNKAYFCIGLQSHPEAEEESFFEPVFKSFAQAL